jgi:glutathione S-transferase
MTATLVRPRLYAASNTGAFAVEAAFAMAGAAYDTVPIDTKTGEQQTPEFTAINPMQQVPVLILEDGTVLTESVAIVLHLADRYPASAIAPPPGTPDSARFLRWLVFIGVNVYEADLRYFYPERYTDAAGVPATKAAAARHMARQFAILENTALSPGPFLCGDTFSIADVFLAMVAQWSPEPVTAPRTLAVCTAVAAHPLIGPLWRQHGFA